MIYQAIEVNQASPIELSVVATVYNDATIVPLLVEQIRKAIEPLQISWEIVLANDRSTDNSWDAIVTEARKDPRVKGIQLARNRGQQVAMSAGIHHATGNVVVIMDGDLQHPPAAVPMIYQRVKSGDELVYTVSTTRNSFTDELLSKLFWVTLTRVFGVSTIPNQLMMKGLSRRLVLYFATYGEVNRAVTGVVQDIGLRWSVVEVETQRRPIGASHQRFSQRLKLAFDLLFDLSTTPLDSLLTIGAAGVVFAVLFGSFHLYRYFFEDIRPGFTSLISLLTLFGSANLFMLGIIGRYLANIFREVRGRPLYLVDQRVNFDERALFPVASLAATPTGPRAE